MHTAKHCAHLYRKLVRVRACVYVCVFHYCTPEGSPVCVSSHVKIVQFV